MKNSVNSFFKNLMLIFTPNKPALIAILLGALSVLAFAPFDLSPLILISISGLFILWFEAKTNHASIQIGLWYGLGLFGFGASWLFSSMYFYSGVVLPLAVLLTAIFVLFLSLSVALSGWLAFYFKNANRPAGTLVILFPALWLVSELVRSGVFGGFPFLLSGVTHIDTWLDGYAPVFGVWGVSWALAISAGLIVWLFITRSWVMASLCFCLLWSGGGFLQQTQWVTPIEKPVDIALIQGNIAQEKKWQPNAFFPTLKTYIELTKKHLDADVVVWPETAVPAYYHMVERGALSQFIKDAQMLDTDILIGVIDGKRGSDVYYNALINVHKPDDRYYKQHLVPFSEYFPFNDFFKFVSGLFDIPFATFTAGQANQPLMNLGGHSVGLGICYEMAFGEEIASRLPEAKYIVTVSNDAWFANTFQPAQQLQDVQMRALELGREIARATNTGYTAIVDIKGEIKAEIPAYEQDVLRGEIQPYEGLTFYAEWKKLPVLFMLFMLFGFLLAKRYLFGLSKQPQPK